MAKTVSVLLSLASGLATWTGCAGVSTSQSPQKITQTTIAISPTALAAATVGIPYSAGFSASGGQAPYQWTIASGALPTGIQLNATSGLLAGIPTIAGTSDFVAGVTDHNGNSTERSLNLLVSSQSTLTPCAPPAYGCARTDASVIPLGTVPAWGGLTGANTAFYDSGFNPSSPAQYVRVTDANSTAPAIAAGQANERYGSFAVGSGSGDDAHFNADDSLFTVTDGDQDYYIYGLNQNTMTTGLVWFTLDWVNLIWSQVNRNYLYAVGADPHLWRLDLSNCFLGGPACSPASTALYDFTNCNFPAGYAFFVNAGIGGSDTVFASAVGAQDSDNRVYAYNAATNTCYLYNTRFGTIHSFSATQTAATGTLTCDGSMNVAGSGFSTGWLGLSISLTAGGTTLVFQVASVADATHLTLGASCTKGTYAYSTVPGTLLGTISSTERYSVHDIRMDPAGVWLIVEEGSYCYSSTCNVIHAWKIGTTTVNGCQWTAGGTDAGSCASHYTETASGWINADNVFSNTGPSMQFRAWDNMSTTNGSNVFEMDTVNVSSFPDFDDHPTNKNDPLGTHDYPVLTSTYSPETPAGAITYPYSNEIIGWNQGGGPVFRFGHTFNSSLEPSSCCFTAEYAIGAVSSTGKYYLFTSDGEGTLGSTTGATACSITAGNCRSDVFLLNLAPPAAN